MCGLPACPITRRFHALRETKPVSEYMGASPSVFVGSFGGAYNMWNPIDKLLTFAIVYFVGLTLAMLIFLSKKLLTTIKEDE